MGRKPVIEALHDTSLTIDKILVSSRAHGPEIDTINGMAPAEGYRSSMSPNRRSPPWPEQSAPSGCGCRRGRSAMQSIGDFCEQRTRGKDWACSVLVLDHVHNPANVGMILRSATAAGIDGIVVPFRGTAEVGPVAIKASAGVAFRAPILRATDTAEALTILASHRFTIVGLD